MMWPHISLKSSMRGHRNDHRDQVDDFGRHRRNYDDDKVSRPGRPADRDAGRDRRSPPRRSDSRDRIKHARVDRDVRHTNPYGPAESRAPESRPSSTLVLKGLSSQTTEQALHAHLAQYNPKNILLMTRDGESRHFAFVDFHSVDQAELFLKIFAGSAGDPNAAQLIVENRAVTLEYARESTERPQNNNYSQYQNSCGDSRYGQSQSHPYKGRDREDRDGGGGKGPTSSAGLDWICSSCKGHNFSRRGECYRCSAKRTPDCATVPRGSGPPTADSGHRSAVRADDLESATPGVYLLVRGLSPSADEQYVSGLFRPYAMVKSVSLIRDPCSQFATHLGYIEFYSVEHAQYALQSYNHAHSGSTNEVHGGVSAAAFANVKAMQRLQKEVAQPGSSLAYNPLVAQALQVAQWSAHIGHTAAPPPPPPAPAAPAAPVVAVDSVRSYEQQQQQYAQYALYQQQALQAQQQALLQQQLRWPPHFETNGGAYVYQAKTGCFLEPTSDFYFDPKSKLYYCGQNGAYYSFDEAHVPPFRRFVPSPPPAASVNGSNGTVVAASYDVNELKPPYTVAQSQAPMSAVAAAPVPSPASSAAGNKITLGAKTTVGFGLIGTKNKKVKVDLAKWSALQQDDDEEVVDEKGKGKPNEMLNEHSKNQQEKPSGVEKDASKNGTNNHAGSFQGQEPKVGSKRPLEDSADAFLADFMASSGVANLLASNAPAAAPSMATLASLPPPPPGVRAPPIAVALPVAAVAKSPIVVPAATAAAPVSSLPVCLLCQRQFPSFEMLQRHEKESKLHADNLKKSLGLI